MAQWSTPRAKSLAVSAAVQSRMSRTALHVRHQQLGMAWAQQVRERVSQTRVQVQVAMGLDALFGGVVPREVT